MELKVLTRLDQVPAERWNALRGSDNPFLRYEFLAALERHGCVAPDKGWLPSHLTLWEGERLLAAAPSYLKSHSWGEFVFDWSWAEASERLGSRYYPKRVCAVPFSPVGGKRVLVHPEADASALERLLAESARELCAPLGLSSAHWLFLPQDQCQSMTESGYLRRIGYQYHWHNQGYESFEHFLGALNAKKRKNIRQERRRILELPISFRRLSGQEIEPPLWRAFYRFYVDTFRAHGNPPPLTLSLFQELGARLGDRLLLIVAESRGEALAAALFLRSEDTLYGRYWGAHQPINGLHFETCYYQGIEYCIEHGIRRFEPGAQGEHKIPRGFLPVRTYSAHWLADPRLRAAVEGFLRRESAAVDAYVAEVGSDGPYRQVTP